MARLRRDGAPPLRCRLERMHVSFEISDRNYEELGRWPLEIGATARAQLYAYQDHSPAQHGGRVLLPDIALAPAGTTLGLRRIAVLTTAFRGLIGELRARRGSGPERRDEAMLRLECGAPISLVLTVRRWDKIDVAPTSPPPGVEAWRLARNPRVADVLCGLLELQEAAFEVGGVSSFPLLDDHAPDYPVTGTVQQIERLDLDPASADFGTAVSVESLPDGLFWPHRYFVTLTV
jgi:hypothetical protein